MHGDGLFEAEDVVESGCVAAYLAVHGDGVFAVFGGASVCSFLVFVSYLYLSFSELFLVMIWFGFGC